jgi:hypothetical protein
MRSISEVTRKRIYRWALIIPAISAIFLITAPAFAGAGTAKGTELTGALAGIFGVALVGFGLGAFGLIVNHIFYKRTVLTYIIMKKKPGMSFLVGLVFTLLGLGLVALFQGTEWLQGIIMLLYLLGLGMFGIGAVIRLAAHIVEPRIIEDELPTTWAFIKGGFIFMAINIVVVIGNALAIGTLIAGVGATMMSYFAGMGKAVSDVTQVDNLPTPEKTE